MNTPIPLKQYIKMAFYHPRLLKSQRTDFLYYELPARFQAEGWQSKYLHCIQEDDTSFTQKSKFRVIVQFSSLIVQFIALCFSHTSFFLIPLFKSGCFLTLNSYQARQLSKNYLAIPSKWNVDSLKEQLAHPKACLLFTIILDIKIYQLYLKAYIIKS